MFKYITIFLYKTSVILLILTVHNNAENSLFFRNDTFYSSAENLICLLI